MRIMYMDNMLLLLHNVPTALGTTFEMRDLTAYLKCGRLSRWTSDDHGGVTGDSLHTLPSDRKVSRQS